MNTGPRAEIQGMFDGPVVPLTVRIGTPILLANFLQFLYTVVDTWFISRIDPSSTALLSGTGLLFPLMFLFMALGSAISVGVSSLVGRAIGARDEDVLKHVVGSGVGIALVIGVPTLLVGYVWGGPIVRGLAGEGMSSEALRYALSYMRWLLPGFTLMLVGHAFMGTLQGEGLTGVIARAMILSTIVNIILDPVCIFVLDMGVAGAALATTVAICTASVYVATFFVRGKSTVPATLNPGAGSRSAVREIVRVGLPHFLSMASMSIGFMILNKLVSTLGESEMNSWTLAGRMDQLVLIPSFAVAGATIPMLSQNFGRGNMQRVLKIYRVNILIALSLVGMAVVAYYLAARPLLGRFSDVASVVDGAVAQVRLLSPTFLGISVAIVSASAFTATGKPMPALLITIFRMGVLGVPLSYLFALTFDMGMTGVFAGMALANTVAPLIAYAYARWYLQKSALEHRGSSGQTA